MIGLPGTLAISRYLRGILMVQRDHSKRYLGVPLISAALCLAVTGTVRAEVASIYGGPDGLCGSRTANGERLNCAAMTAAHRTLPFGTLVEVCHNGCVTVRINDRGPFVRGRQIDLSPAAARAIKLNQTGHVTINRVAFASTPSRQPLSSEVGVIADSAFQGGGVQGGNIIDLVFNSSSIFFSASSLGGISSTGSNVVNAGSNPSTYTK